MLLTKTLRSTTFKLALISIGVFGAVVIALFGYVYWSTTTFVLSRSDSVIVAEQAMLRNIYDAGGRDGVVRAIDQHKAAARLEGGVYLLANESFVPVIGNLAEWPSALRGANEWGEFKSAALVPKAAASQSLFRAKWETLPDGFHLLVGRDISDLGRFADKIYAALAFTILLIFVLAAVASVSVTRRTVGRIESINATSRSIMESGLGGRIPLRGTQDEWDHLAQNLNSMLERIEGLMAEVNQVSAALCVGSTAMAAHMGGGGGWGGGGGKMSAGRAPMMMNGAGSMDPTMRGGPMTAAPITRGGPMTTAPITGGGVQGWNGRTSWGHFHDHFHHRFHHRNFFAFGFGGPIYDYALFLGPFQL